VLIKNNRELKIIVFFVILAIFYGISFGITGLIIKGICWAFGFAFSWKFLNFLCFLTLNAFKGWWWGEFTGIL